MEYKSLLTELLESLKISKKKFAEELGVSQGNVSDWFNRPGYKPSIVALKRISDTFNVNLNWLITGAGEMYIDTRTREAQNTIEIPVYAEIAAGIGIEAEEVEPTQFIAIQKSELKGHNGPFYAFEVSGVSMEPEMRTGDIIIVAGWNYEYNYHGEFCAFRTVDGLVVKRLFYDPSAKRLYLVPLNPSKPITKYDEDSADLTLIGVIVALFRSYKKGDTP